MPKIEKHNEISEAKERRSTFVLDTVQNDESNDVRKCTCTILFFKSFYLLLYCCLIDQASGWFIKRIYASGCFVRMKNNKFKNVLRPFDTEILKTF